MDPPRSLWVRGTAPSRTPPLRDSGPVTATRRNGTVGHARRARCTSVWVTSSLMSWNLWKSLRVRATVAAAAAGVIALAGLSGGGVAGASTHSPARSRHSGAGQTSGHEHHGPKLPVVRHATNLAVEPVVRASKGKPPKRLEVKDLVVGTGATVSSTSTVSVVYVGADYKTGKDFTQATWSAKKATTFPLDRVVAGFAEGLVGMKVGGRREIVIPPKLGYGKTHYGAIKANETLVFVVDLKGVSG